MKMGSQQKYNRKIYKGCSPNFRSEMSEQFPEIHRILCMLDSKDVEMKLLGITLSLTFLPEDDVELINKNIKYTKEENTVIEILSSLVSMGITNMILDGTIEEAWKNRKESNG